MRGCQCGTCQTCKGRERKKRQRAKSKEIIKAGQAGYTHVQLIAALKNAGPLDRVNRPVLSENASLLEQAVHRVRATKWDELYGAPVTPPPPPPSEEVWLDKLLPS